MYFDFYINNPEDYDTIATSWKSFVAKKLSSPFPIDFYKISVFLIGIEKGGDILFDHDFSCSNSTATNLIVRSLTRSDRGLSHVSCGKAEWTWFSSGFCVGCEPYSESCSNPLHGIISMPNGKGCVDEFKSKVAGAVIFEYENIVAETVPKMRNLSVEASSNSSKITAVITTTSAGGILYCYAEYANVPSPDRYKVKTKGVASVIPRALSTLNVTVNVIVSDLIPSTDYTVYCFLEDSKGNADSSSNMLRFKRRFTSQCCRLVTFTHAPKLVFTDMVTNNMNDVVFKYELPRRPSLYPLKIIPRFKNANTGQFATDIVATPTFAIYTQENEHHGLTREFVVSSPTVYIGDSYIVTLDVVGAEADKYVSLHRDYPQFLVIDASYELPPPVIDTIEIAANGRDITICFDLDAVSRPQIFNLAPVSTSWQCSNIFVFPGNDLSVCLWQTAKCVLVTPCGGSICDGLDRSTLDIVEPGDAIALQPNLFVVRSRLLTTDTGMTVSPPVNAISPRIFMKSNQPGGSCESDLIIDASASYGSGGRAWKEVEWSISCANPSVDITEVQLFLENITHISPPIVVPYYLLVGQETYTISLRLQNYLRQTSIGSLDFIVYPETVNVVNITIDGLPFRIIKTFEEFVASASLWLPPCISYSNITYVWKVFSNSIVTEVVSESADPRVFKVAPYTFRPNQLYQLLVDVIVDEIWTDLATLFVFVESGSVYVSISGENAALLPQGAPLSFDTSRSVFEDLAPGTSVLDLRWNCKISAVLSNTTQDGNLTYGSNCDHTLYSTSFKSTEPVHVITDAMSSIYEYSFYVAAYSPSAAVTVSSSVTIRIGDTSSGPLVHILSSFRKFNPSKFLRLRGAIGISDNSSGVVNATWSLFGPGGELSLHGLVNTPISREISYGNASTFYMSLSSIPFTYKPGVPYTFRLSAVSKSNPNSEMWAQITLTANTPPTSGSLLLSPSTGLELTTDFIFSARDWTDDISDYPLTFAFSCSKSPLESEGAVAAVVGLKGHSTVMTSTLPSGMEVWAHMVFCSVEVSDFYESSSHADAKVSVFPGNVTLEIHSLRNAILNAYTARDASAIVSLVYNAAETLNAANCSGAPNCLSLNRHDCSRVSHTCGLCLNGYTGVPFHSNLPCYLPSSGNDIGDACASDSECLYGQCIQGLCVEPNKQCPSTQYNTICSGNGACAFSQTSGGITSSCGATRDDCYAFCACEDGYHGVACEYSFDEYLERSELRGLMCDALTSIYDIQDNSQSLLSAMASSLLHVFVPGDISSNTTLHACARVLMDLIELTEAGLLRNDDLYASQSPQKHILELVSAFSATVQYLRLKNETNPYDDMNLIALGDLLEEMVSSVATSIHNDMVVGEAEHQVVSAGVKFKVMYALVDNLSNAALTSSDTGHYLVLPRSGLNFCNWQPEINSTDAYARISIAEWVINPHPLEQSGYTGEMAGNLLRFSTAGLTNNAEKYNRTEPYQLIFTYNSPKNWSSMYPECVSFNDETNSYDECPCNVTHFTSYNVTLECYNLYDLCPIQSRRRKLQLTDMFVDLEHPHNSYHRRLDFDYAGDNDDDEDSSKPNVNQYGTLVRSIKRDIIQTLTNNPLETIDSITQAMPVLTLLIFFVFMLLLGWQYFATWDESDYNAIRYSRELFEEKRKKRANILQTRSLRLLEAFMGTGYAAEKRSMPPLHTLPSLKSQKSVTIVDPAVPTKSIDVDLVPPPQKCWYDWLFGSRTMSMKSKSLKSHLRSDEFTSYGVNNRLLSRASCGRSRKYVTKENSSERIQIGDVDTSDSVDMTSLDKFFCSVDEDEDMWGAVKFENDDDTQTHCQDELFSWDDAMVTTEVVSCRLGEEDTTRSIDTFSVDSSGQQIHTESVYPSFEPNSIRKLNLLNYSGQQNLSSSVESEKQVLDAVFPASSLLESKSAWKRFVQAVFREHDWVRMFSYPSIRLPRRLRFLVVCSNILIIMFVDSLFYGILFADEEACDRLSETTQKECESAASTMRDDTSKCMWNEVDQSCTLRPPPSSIQFYLFVTLFVAIFTVAPTLMCQVLLEEVCSKRPKFSDNVPSTTWGSATNSSLGKAIKARNIGEDPKMGRMLDLYTYLEFSSVKEETNILLSSVEASLQNALMESRLPWHVVSDTNEENMKALMDFISVYPDGSPMPLTLYQRCFFGTPRKRIEWKIKRVRQRVEGILEELNLFVPGEDDYKDMLLIQHFILEQLSPFKRYALRKEFFQFDNALPGYVEGWKWVLAWCIVMATWLFYMLWIFQWAALHSEVTMVSWFIQLVLAVLQDVFIVEVVQIYVVHVLAIEALRPQLKRIYHTLNNIVIDKLHKGAISMRNVNVVQHLSAACRAARTRAAQNLPAAQLLMRIDDADVARCRNHQSDQLGWIIIAVIAIPTALALAPDSVQQGIMELVIPTVWCCFLLCNYYLYDISPYLLAAPYVLLVTYLMYYYLVLKPRRHTKSSRITSMWRDGVRDARTHKGGAYFFDCFGLTSDQKRSFEKQTLQWRNMNLPLSLVIHEEVSESPAAQFQPSSSDRNYELLRRNSLARRCSVGRRHTWLFVDDVSEDAHPTFPLQLKACHASENTWLCDHVASTSRMPAMSMDDSSKMSGDTSGDLPDEIVSMKVNASKENFVHRNLQSRRNSARLMNKYVWNAEMA